MSKRHLDAVLLDLGRTQPDLMPQIRRVLSSSQKTALQERLDGLGPEDFIKEFERASHLSKVSPALAKIMTEDGDGKKDKVSVKKVSLAASNLKPSQTTMVLDKSLGMALGMLSKGEVGGDLGAIVSSDGFIMDGHHRWSATILAGGNTAKVGGYQAALKGEDLLRTLNLLTKGHFNRSEGKAGKGKLSDYTIAKVKKRLTDMTKNGVQGDRPLTGEAIQKTLTDAFESVENGIDTISKNAKYITTSTPSWAPARQDMPVINPKEVPAATKKLQNGEVIIPPKSLAARVASLYMKKIGLRQC